MPSSDTLSLGPGKLSYAALGTAEPVDLSPLSPTLFQEIGYTEEGSEFSYELSRDPVEVAESMDPLFYKTTSRSGTVSFSMAENTIRNLTLAFNGGEVTSTADVVTYQPPEPGEDISRMLVLDSEDGEERWVWRQVSQGGSVALTRKKGADKTVIPVEFMVEKPASGKRPWIAIYKLNRSGLAA